MTAKEYLSQAINIDYKISSLEKAAERERERATSTGVNVSDIAPQFTGTNSDKVGNAATNAAYNDALAAELKRDAVIMRNTILLEINKMNNNVLSSLLIDKYINNLSWEEIAERLEKNVDYVKGELHAKALNSFQNTSRNTTKPPCCC